MTEKQYRAELEAARRSWERLDQMRPMIGLAYPETVLDVQRVMLAAKLGIISAAEHKSGQDILEESGGLRGVKWIGEA